MCARVLWLGIYAIVFVQPSSSALAGGALKVYSVGFPPDLTLGAQTGAHCVVEKDGSGPISILWRKDGLELESDDRMTVTMLSTGSSTLTIRRIKPADIGNYTCIARSVQGSSEITVPLTVLGEYSI
ncbi:unnamed protein product [Ixodes pacificus]